MINLIPPHAKKKIQVEYWVRVCSVWMLVWAFAFVCSVAIIFPAYVLINTQVETYMESAAEAEQKVADYQTVASGLSQASQQASIIVQEESLPVVSDFVDAFFSLQGQQIQLSKITIGRDESGIAPASLAGVADDRQSLATFRDKLLAQDFVTSVDLPIANLAQDKDIQFSLTVTINNSSI